MGKETKDAFIDITKIIENFSEKNDVSEMDFSMLVVRNLLQSMANAVVISAVEYPDDFCLFVEDFELINSRVSRILSGDISLSNFSECLNRETNRSH